MKDLTMSDPFSKLRDVRRHSNLVSVLALGRVAGSSHEEKAFAKKQQQ